MYYLPISIAVSVVMGLLFAASRRAKPLKTIDGGYLLQYAGAIKAFAVLFIIIAVGFPIYMLLHTPIKDQGDLIAAVLIVVLFIAFSVCFFIEFFTVKIWVGPSGIRATSGWRGRRDYQWHEVRRITYSSSTAWFKIVFGGKKPLRVHRMISGIDRFQEIITEKLPEIIWASALEDYGRDRRYKG